jgi:small subunit ribosomal protein S16
MALKIRLRQQGRTNLSVYRLVVTDARSPRDGKYIEMLGWYDPNRAEDVANIQPERIGHWLSNGAIPTEKAQRLIESLAPDVLKAWKQKQLAQKAKCCAKKRKWRQNQEAVSV